MLCVAVSTTTTTGDNIAAVEWESLQGECTQQHIQKLTHLIRNDDLPPNHNHATTHSARRRVDSFFCLVVALSLFPLEASLCEKKIHTIIYAWWEFIKPFHTSLLVVLAVVWCGGKEEMRKFMTINNGKCARKWVIFHSSSATTHTTPARLLCVFPITTMRLAGVVKPENALIHSLFSRGRFTWIRQE